jgi:hypothetical protein
VQAVEWRAVLDGQLIERQMLGRFRDRALEFGLPSVERLARPRVDEVERVALEIRARDGDRVERFLRGVQAAEFLQRRRLSDSRKTASPRRWLGSLRA